MDLIDLQGISGVFRWGPAMQAFLKDKSKEDIVALAPQGIDEPSWLTAIAIKILETKFADENELWQLLAEKADKFLDKCEKKEDGLKKAAEVVNSIA